MRRARRDLGLDPWDLRRLSRLGAPCVARSAFSAGGRPFLFWPGQVPSDPADKWREKETYHPVIERSCPDHDLDWVALCQSRFLFFLSQVVLASVSNLMLTLDAHSLSSRAFSFV